MILIRTFDECRTSTKINLMKKIILFALITFSAAITKAQTIHLGIKGGANLTKIDGESFKNEYELGYQAGGFLDIDFNKTWGIQPEVLFSQSQTKIDSGFTFYKPNAVIGSKAHLNYLSIPVLLRLNVSNLITLNAGPQFSILTNKDESLVNNGKDAFKNGDVAAVFGAEVNLHALQVYGRYTIGLNNLNDIGDQQKWKSRQIQIGLGYKIL